MGDVLDIFINGSYSLKSVIVIQIMLLFYMGYIFIQILSVNTKIKSMFLIFAIFLLSTSSLYPHDIVNIPAIIQNLSPINSAIFGLFLAIIMIVARELNTSPIISPLLFFISIFIIVPALNISIITTIAIAGALGKLFGFLLSYIVVQYVKK